MSTPRGITLVELLIGAALLLAIMLAVFSTALLQARANRHARNLSAAMNDVNRVMERLWYENRGAGGAVSDRGRLLAE